MDPCKRELASGKRFASFGFLAAVIASTVALHGTAIAGLANAETQTWAKSYGSLQDENVFRSVVALSDGSGGNVIAGMTNSAGAGENDIWLIRLDSSGDIVWQKTYGGPRNEETRSIQETSDGGLVVTGPTNSFGSGANDIWVIKLDSSGNVQWEKTYGGPAADVSHSIQQTSDGGYVVAGFTKSFGAGLQDYFVLKLDSNGVIVWQKAFGGGGNEVIRYIKQVSDGGYLAAGFTHSFGSEGDIMLIKLDAEGNMEWDLRYGGSKFEEASTILEVAGGYMVLEQSGSFSDNMDGWLFKIDYDGQIVWQTRVGGGAFDELSAAVQTPDGGFIAAGETMSFGLSAEDFWVVKFDSSGNVEWQMRYGGSEVEEAESIALTPEGGYIAVGTTRSFGEGLRDIWAVKIDATGALTGCGPGVTAQSTDAATANTSSDATDTGAVASDSFAEVKNSLATMGNTDAGISIQCAPDEPQPPVTCDDPTIIGTDGNDVIEGTPAADVISAKGGDDTINGLGGNDIICGGGGNDAISAGSGDDAIFGGYGNDSIIGGLGNDELNGGAGDDSLDGNGGNDNLFGSSGNDTLNGKDGSVGNDTLDGGVGTDTCNGNPDVELHCEI